MYQYLVSNGINPVFDLYLAHPRIPLFLGSMANQSITLYKNSLVLVFMNEDKDLKLEDLELLEVNYSINNIIKLDIIFCKNAG